MYEAGFSLRTRPFSPHPADGQFLSSPRLEDALEGTLAAALVGTGIAAVTGPSGVGKTAFCLELARRTIKPWKPVFLGSARFSNPGEIWQAVLCALERDFTGLTPYEARLHIIEAARKRASGGGGLLLILDEAHLLDAGLLEELRVLTSEVEAGRPMIRLVLSGQMELEERLAMPELTALNQRLGSHVLLELLTREESRQFIGQQVASAGGRVEEVFAEDALELICAACDGNCRCLNLLCDHTLLLAYVAEERPAAAATVQAALDDLKGLPLQWYQPPTGLESFQTESDEAQPLEPAQTPADDPFAAGGSAVTGGSGGESAGTDRGWGDADVAVIEFGGEDAGAAEPPGPVPASDRSEELAEPDEGMTDSGAGDEEADAAECLSFNNEESSASGSTDEVVETRVDDPYAQLDRLSELGLVPPAGTAAPPTHRPKPGEDRPFETIADSSPEAELLGQIQELHNTIQERLPDDSRETHAPRAADDQELWGEPEAAWDVIEPEDEGRREETGAVAGAPISAPRDTRAPFTGAGGDAIQSVMDDERSQREDERRETPSANRYARLFTQLKRRRREAAEAMWAGISLTDR